jgi:hypothetical protein
MSYARRVPTSNELDVDRTFIFFVHTEGLGGADRISRLVKRDDLPSMKAADAIVVREFGQQHQEYRLMGKWRGKEFELTEASWGVVGQLEEIEVRVQPNPYDYD